IYGTRAFKTTEIKTGEFIPLVLFGSYWLDKEFSIFRFCGENELSADLSDYLTKSVPYFYIIGVQIEPSSKN
ncbi:MAG: DUF5041 domain-containing protein, partial [Paramuribaculum sp.]|nr:DUF5041 domain-containing protein [Paramuribaculum sp.]